MKVVPNKKRIVLNKKYEAGIISVLLTDILGVKIIQTGGSSLIVKNQHGNIFQLSVIESITFINEKLGIRRVRAKSKINLKGLL